jgi:signal transduction histidine kinase/CheY-like chemotaxis protein
MILKSLKRISSLRLRLVVNILFWISPLLALTLLSNQSWFRQYSPCFVREYLSNQPWLNILLVLTVLVVVWYGVEYLILRQIRALTNALLRLNSGEWEGRTEPSDAKGELGQFVNQFDEMAEAFLKKQQAWDEADRKLLNRAMLQTSVAVVGQCALTSRDLAVICEQAVYRVTEMFGMEYGMLFQRLPDGRLQLIASTGYQVSENDEASPANQSRSQMAWTAETGELSMVNDWNQETGFEKPPLLATLAVRSGLAAAIPTRGRPYGVLAVHSTSRRVFSADEIQFLHAVANIVGMAHERLKAEAETEMLAAFVKENPNAAMGLTAEGEVNYYNSAAQKLAAAVGRNHPAELLPDPIGPILNNCLATGQSISGLITQINDQTISWAFHPLATGNLVHCYAKNITSRLNLEEQLRQSQKMESIGRLAAGVAHDFNNMLTIIQGHSSRLLNHAGLNGESREAVEAVHGAAERAAGLTRQLLMFSRKNVIQPQPLDLRQVVGNMNKLLCRLLGETITFNFTPPPELSNIRGDTGMIEQILMNFAVNAHDAMAEGGTLTVTLSEMDADPEALRYHPDVPPGRFVRMDVTDTGCGMTDEVRARIFEPFFTTKEVGKGTGLGLATVFGIVKQHSGWIEVASTPGHGSTFTVFFPVCTDALPETAETHAAPACGGCETVLVVEDEDAIREMACLFLNDGGYQVLTAASGREALEVWREHSDKIDLLLTDMKMPEGVSGLQLAEEMLRTRPNLKIVFTSGYSEDTVSSEFLTRTGARFLPKPYSYSAITQIIRESLDAPVPQA